MKNIEFYAEKIKEYENIEFCASFTRPVILKSASCASVSCNKCFLLQIAWALEEYQEPEPEPVDWSKVPVDTKIYVRDDEADDWEPQHFAKFKDGKVYAWCMGATSFSSGDVNSIPWLYAKLAEEDNGQTT